MRAHRKRCALAAVRKKMKLISDIRLYKSDYKNIDGNSLPTDLGNRPLELTAHRIAMKLRENPFSLGEFDHLYLNFTPCEPDGVIQCAERSADRYHPWYRYYDVGVSREEFERLGMPDMAPTILALLKRTLIEQFTTEKAMKQAVEAAVREAVTKGPEMRMKFKEKKAAKTTAVISLQFLDNAMYLPVLWVYDLQGNELLRKKLPATIDFSSLGEIQLSSKKVTVKPRKNAFARSLKPISFTF